MEILVLIVLLVAAYWAKNNLLKPETSQAIDDFSNRGLDFVKSKFNAPVESVTDSENQEIKPQVNAVSAEDIQSPVGNDQPVQSETAQSSVTPAAIKSPEKAVDRVPEDSVLNRHYLAQLAAERAAITHPYPTDSVLRRHYENSIQIVSRPVSTVQVAESTEVVNISETISPTSAIAKQAVPEDSVLRRHFVAQVEADMRKDAVDMPTDAILKRHFAQLIESKIANYLAELEEETA